MSSGTVIWAHRTATFNTNHGDMSGVGGGYISNLKASITVSQNPVVPLPYRQYEVQNSQ